MSRPGPDSLRALILAPAGDDAAAAAAVLADAALSSHHCADLAAFLAQLDSGAGVGLLSDDGLMDLDLSRLRDWIEAQPAWSDFPFIVMRAGAGGTAGDPLVDRLSEVLGNVLFIERPFHPTSLVSLVRTATRSRRRQYEARIRLQALHQQEEQLRIAQQAGNVGSFELFPATGLIELSDQFRLIWGLDRDRKYRLDELVALVRPDDRERVKTASGAPLEQALRYTEYRITRPDTGEVRWIARRGEAVADPTTGGRRFLGVVYDISAQKHVEEQLEISQGALRLATDAAEVGTWDLDLATDRLTWSDRTRTIFGLAPGAPVSMRVFYEALHPDDLDETSAAFLATMDPRTRTTYDVEYRVRQPDGATRWVAAKGRGLFDRDGQCVRAVGTAIDITARKAAEARHLLLLRLADVLQPLSQPRAIMAAAVEMLGRHLGVSRIGYGQIDDDDRAILLETDYVDGVEHLQGTFPLDDFGPAHIAKLRRGQTSFYADVAADPDTAQAFFDRIRARAVIAVPYLRDGRLRAVFYVNHLTPRPWLPEEVALVEEVAARTWDAFERARVQDALRAREAELRLIADALPVLIGLADRDLVYRFANRAYEDWFFRPSEQAIGSSIRAFVGEAGFDLRRPYIQRALAGEAVRFEMSWPHRDGRERFAEIRYLPRHQPDGEVDGFYIFILDVTDRKRAEELLRQRNEILRERVEERTRERDRLWRLSQELMLVSAGNGAITSINPSVTRVLGWEEAEMVGRRLEEFLHPDDAAQSPVAAGEAALALQFVNRYRSRDGSYRTLDWTAVRQDGSLHAIARDVTEEVARRAELATAQDQLRQAQKMEAVGQLTGGIAHDFNNLLQGITGSLELTRRRIAQGRFDEIERFISGAMTSAQRAAGLTHRLLAFSRRQPLDPKPVAANPLVASMEDLLRRTLGELIRLELALADDLWFTLCDPNQLESAILNLCINARDAMPDGGTLRLETRNAGFAAGVARPADLSPGDYIRFAVTDTGVGMSKEVVDRAFDPFFTTKPIGQGTGLGLSMIYGFARQSEGMAKIDSVPGAGTTVSLYLPRHRGDLADGEDVGELSEVHRTSDGETVLLVEDEVVVRSLIVDVLTELGYRVIEAEDGPSALEVLRSTRQIDLLVTDIGLPGLNGRQVADAARIGRPDLKILFMTGYAETAAQAQGFLDPGMAIIPKPFPMEVLAEKIRQMTGEG